MNLEKSSDSKPTAAEVREESLFPSLSGSRELSFRSTVEKSMPDGSQGDATNGSAIVKPPQGEFLHS